MAMVTAIRQEQAISGDRDAAKPYHESEDCCSGAGFRGWSCDGCPCCNWSEVESAVSIDLLDKREARIRRMFGNIAPRYDLLNHLLSLNIDRYWRWRTTRLVPPSGTAPILDVCTGTGDLALAYDRAGR